MAKFQVTRVAIKEALSILSLSLQLKGLYVRGTMFVHSKRTRIIIFFFMFCHRGIRTNPRNLELGFIVTRDDNVVDLN